LIFRLLQNTFKGKIDYAQGLLEEGEKK